MSIFRIMLNGRQHHSKYINELGNGGEMKITHNGKRYDSDKCTRIAYKDLYSYSNNYAGTMGLMVASDGTFILHTDSNGQDCYIRDDISVLSKDEAVLWLEEHSADMDEEEEELCVKHGLIEIVE